MRPRAKLGWTVFGSFLATVGLWVAFAHGLGYSTDEATAASGALLAFLGGLGGVWAQLPRGEAGRSAGDQAVNTGSLKGVTSTFADRCDEWLSIRDLARRARHRDGMRIAILIHGMPGVGKTEFAQYLAHRLIGECRRYAGRRHLDVLACQVELHGLEGGSRTDPRDALRFQLDLAGPDPRRSTMNLDELAAEWRKYLQGKLLILVLDNADDEEQVWPFLPGGSSYIILITGRRILQGLIAWGVVPFQLNVLDEVGAMLMVANIVTHEFNDDDRQLVARIIRQCGYHPLAIKLAVQPLAGRRWSSLAVRQQQLARQSHRIAIMGEYGERDSEVSDGVVQAFDLSYTNLSDSAKLVLRRVALAPVTAVDAPAAASLTNLAVDEVATILDDLVGESLISEDGSGSRYQMHDEVRRYSRRLAERDGSQENRLAIDRLFAYYCDSAAQADVILTRQSPPLVIQQPESMIRNEFASRSELIAWSQEELLNLLACADYAVTQGENGQREDGAWIVIFSGVLAGILRNAGRWRRSIDLQSAALKAAGAMGAPLAEANALSERALLYRLTGELEAAVADLDRSIALYQQGSGSAARIGEANARNTYGVVLDQLDKPSESARQLSAAFAIYLELDSQLGMANVCHDQGMAKFFAKDYDSAVTLLAQALDMYRTVDQPLGLAHAHTNLARACQSVGQLAQAADNLQAARQLYESLGNPLGEINVLVRLGAVLRQSDQRRAAEVLAEAIDLSYVIESPLARIDALSELGDVYAEAGRKRDAKSAWSRALRLARSHGVEREGAKLTAKLGQGR